MTVQDLAERVSSKHELSRSEARAILDSAFQAMAEAARGGEEIAVPGFGKFKVRERKARQARNPQTGEPMQVPASRKLAFLPAKPLKDSMNPTAKSASGSAKSASKSASGAAKSASSARKPPAKGRASGGAEKPAAAKPAQSKAKASRKAS